VEQLLLELAPPPAPTLENFHAGANSALLGALRAALAGGERVFYLWGAAGCGKSHLLRAMADAAGAQGRQAAYLRAPDFDLPPQPQMLALDDIGQLPAGAQIAMFDAYNRLRAAGALIVAAGNLPPTDLPLREDLRTRVASGVVMQVHALSEEEKRAVLEAQARQRGLDLAPGIVDFLLARFPRDLGSLIAAVAALDRYSLQTQRAITLPLLREAMRLQADKP